MDKQRYEELKLYANKHKPDAILKLFSEEEVLEAYNKVSNIYNLTIRAYIPSWVNEVKSCRDKIMIKKEEKKNREVGG